MRRMKTGYATVLGVLIAIVPVALIGCTAGDEQKVNEETRGTTSGARPTGANGQAANADEAARLVADALKADPTLRDIHLKVEEEAGKVLLKGKVNSPAQKTAAEDLARRTAAGYPLESKIEVEN